MERDPVQIRRISDKIVMLWELNPQWRIGELIDNAHFLIEVEHGVDELGRVSDEHMETALDELLERSKNAPSTRSR